MTAPAFPPNAPSIANGRYVLVARIGEGGMAGVYRAYDRKLRVWRAVKVLLPEFAKRPKIRERFASEAHLMARLEHPNIVRVTDVGDAGELPFMVMELVPAGTLLGWTNHYGPMPAHLAVQVTLQLCAAVGAAHAAGVVHRDIKPQNVLISENGTCKLADFGIAQWDDSDRSRTGSVLGTLGYMSPEQRNDAKSVDHRADIYSIGATLVHLLSGDEVTDVFVAAENPQVLASVPERLRPIVLRCVAYDRNRRYPDVGALARDLERLLEQLPALPGTPDLVLDLSEEEEPVTEDTAFEEIRAILDASGRSSTPEPAAHTATPGKGAPLPYYMPSKPVAARRTPLSADDDVPDWIDRDELASSSSGPQVEEIGVGVPVARQTPAVPERRDPTPPPTVQQDEPPPPEPARPEDDEAFDIRPQVVYDEPAPRAPPPPPPPPEPEPEPEPSGLQQVLTILAIPLSLALGLGTVFLIVLAVLYGITANGLQNAERVTIAERNELYLVLRDERAVVDQLSALGADRDGLADAWLDFSEKRGEPDRQDAAVTYLRLLKVETDKVGLDDASATTHSEAVQTVKRIRAAQGSWERALEDWSAAAASPQGRFVILLGGGSAPP